jgi:putative flavoprotein involved in K+ transport
MLAGELLLVLLAIVDRALRAVSGGVLRLSANRPRRPPAAQFARQAAAAAATAAAGPPPDGTVHVVDAVVVGGASSGVAAAAALAARGVVAAVLDRTAAPGDGWRTRYASLHLHDLADECCLPFMPLPASLPTYVPAAVFADYLDAYARIQRLDWRGGHDVVAVDRAPGGGGAGAGRWRVTARVGAAVVHYDAPTVVFADGGLYNSPVVPPWAAAHAGYTGSVLHSSSLSAAAGRTCGALFKGKRVVVVGFGNSASDVVQECVAAPAAEVVVAVRNPASRPLAPQADVGRFQETNHAYPWLVSAWGDAAADAVQKRCRPLASLLRAAATGVNLLLDAALAARCLRAWGDLAPVGLDALPGDGGFSPVQWTKATSAVMPMDTGAVDLIKSGAARVVRAGVAALGPGRTVAFDDGSSLDADAVVLCTGFASMTQAASLLKCERAKRALGVARGGGLALAPGTFLAKPADATGVIESGKRTPVPGLYFVVGRIAAVADSVLTLAANVAADRDAARGGRRLDAGRKGGVEGLLPGPGADDMPWAPSQKRRQE